MTMRTNSRAAPEILLAMPPSCPAGTANPRYTPAQGQAAAAGSGWAGYLPWQPDRSRSPRFAADSVVSTPDRTALVEGLADGQGPSPKGGRWIVMAGTRQILF